MAEWPNYYWVSLTKLFLLEQSILTTEWPNYWLVRKFNHWRVLHSPIVPHTSFFCTCQYLPILKMQFYTFMLCYFATNFTTRSVRPLGSPRLCWTRIRLIPRFLLGGWTVKISPRFLFLGSVGVVPVLSLKPGWLFVGNPYPRYSMYIWWFLKIRCPKNRWFIIYYYKWLMSDDLQVPLFLRNRHIPTFVARFLMYHTWSIYW